jgi:hypothetical protein
MCFIKDMFGSANRKNSETRKSWLSNTRSQKNAQESFFTNTRFLGFVKIGFSFYGSLLGDPNNFLGAV